MTNRIYVAPAAGKSPRSPVRPFAIVPAEGAWFEDCAAWRRLEEAGDVTISKSAPTAKKAAPAAAAPKK
ncbi:MAG: hypothetical protein AB7S70_00565 [Hyphomicrobium sp.]|uniref:hypothetical protein n=1 Tax=Hyphomicrobium sp. TaxID=82 RepID=UPI003D0DABE2